MQYPLSMGLGQRVGDLCSNTESLLYRQTCRLGLRTRKQSISKRLPVYELHNNEALPAHVTNFVNVQMFE